MLAAGLLPLVGTALVSGVVADRTSRRAVMVAADLMRVASQGAMAAVLIVDTAEVWMFALLPAVAGTATGFFSPASTGLLPEIVPAEKLQPANALHSSATSAGGSSAHSCPGCSSPPPEQVGPSPSSLPPSQ